MRKVILGIVMCLIIISSIGIVGCGEILPPPSGTTTPNRPGEDNTQPNEPPEIPEESIQPEEPEIPETTLSKEIKDKIEKLLKDNYGIEIRIEEEGSTKREAKLVIELEEIVNAGYMEEDMEWILEEIFSEMEGLRYTYEIAEEKVKIYVEKLS